MRGENGEFSCAAVDAGEKYGCRTSYYVSDFYVSCPANQVIYIRSAEVGFSPAVKSNNTDKYCVPLNTTCSRSAINHSAIMNCHGQRYCRMAQGVLNYPLHDRLCENHQNGNFIKIKYDCLNPGKYEERGQSYWLMYA